MARPEPRVSARGKVRLAGSGDWRGPGPHASATRSRALESPGRTPSPRECDLVPERSWRAGLPGENLAPHCWGTLRSPGHPRNTGPGRGLASTLGPHLAGLRPPARVPHPHPPCSFLGLGGGKEAGRFFLMKKKIWAVAPGLSLPPRPPHPSQQILSEESAPPPGISAARTLPGRGRAGGEAEESSTCHFQRL